MFTRLYTGTRFKSSLINALSFFFSLFGFLLATADSNFHTVDLAMLCLDLPFAMEQVCGLAGASLLCIYKEG